jgi:GNAT superfamily N-acetyltransferase
MADAADCNSSSSRTSAGSSDDVRDAIGVFVRAYCAGKCATHPYEASRVGELWVMRDAPRKNPRDYRKEEWVAYGVAPSEVDAAARQHTRGRFFVCPVIAASESDESLKNDYKLLGYRLWAREGLFIHRLAPIPRVRSPLVLARVRTRTMAERFGKATRSRPIPPEHLASNAPFRQYVATEGNALIGWVRRSTNVEGAAWCSDMYVRASHRRQGIGRSLLAKMLRDDRASGARQSVLLASKAGALLYPHVGYEQIGTLLIFAPPKK